MVEQILTLKNRLVGVEDDLSAIASAVDVEAINAEVLFSNYLIFNLYSIHNNFYYIYDIYYII